MLARGGVMRVSVRTVAAGGLAAALIASAAGPASAATTAVSPPSSPYATAGCSAVDRTPGSLNYVNSEVEPQAAVDPTNAQHLVGRGSRTAGPTGGRTAWSPRTPGTAARAGRSAPSRSAPATTSPVSRPYLDYQRASDPWVSIGPGAPGNPSGSTVYSVSVSFDFSAYKADPDGNHNAVGAAASYDGGATWSHVQTLIADAWKRALAVQRRQRAVQRQGVGHCRPDPARRRLRGLGSPDRAAVEPEGLRARARLQGTDHAVEDDGLRRHVVGAPGRRPPAVPGPDDRQRHRRRPLGDALRLLRPHPERVEQGRQPR